MCIVDLKDRKCTSRKGRLWKTRMRVLVMTWETATRALVLMYKTSMHAFMMFKRRLFGQHFSFLPLRRMHDPFGTCLLALEMALSTILGAFERNERILKALTDGLGGRDAFKWLWALMLCG